MYNFRVAELNDLDNVKKCIELAYRPYVIDMGVELSPLMDDYGSLIAKGLVTICESLDNLVAVIVWYYEENCLVVDNVAISPKYQRSGVFLKILHLLIKEAKNHNLNFLRMYVDEKITKNIELYQRFGAEIYKKKKFKGKSVAHLVFDLEKSQNLLAGRILEGATR